MTESEWKLKKENAALKMALCQAQSQLLQAQFNAAQAEDKALGEAWTEPEADQCSESFSPPT